MKLEERLNDIIAEKDEKIEQLENKLEAIERQFDLGRQGWQIHRAFSDDEFSQKMPFPRLEMRLQRVSEDNWYRIEWIYGLVYKHYADTHTDMLRFIPFSCTQSEGGRGTFESYQEKDGKLQLPFRDGAHIRAESMLLGLPAFIICREKGICEHITMDGYEIGRFVEKMRSATK